MKKMVVVMVAMVLGLWGMAWGEMVTVWDSQGRPHMYSIQREGERIGIWNYDTGEYSQGRLQGNQGYLMNWNTGQSYYFHGQGLTPGLIPGLIPEAGR